MSGGLRILVGCKRVIDYAVKIRIRPDSMGIVTDGVKHSMNPFDEIALEQAIQMKEKGIASEILAFTCGINKGQEVLRTALALGADRGILVEVNEALYEQLEPIHISEIMENIVKKEKIDLVLMGKQAIDDDACQSGQLLASRLNWPQATFVSKITKEGDYLIAQQDMDFGLNTVKIKLPAVVTTDLRLNQPRYATLPSIMKAKKKPLDILNLSADLGITVKPHVKRLNVEYPPVRTAGIKVDSVENLVTILKTKGIVD